MSEAQHHTKDPSAAGSANKRNQASPAKGASRPDGAPLASSQTKWDTGDSNARTPSSPAHHSGKTAAGIQSQAQRMHSASEARHVNMPRWAWLWFVLPGAALLLNLRLQNWLWAWYSTCGIVVAGTFWFLAKRHGWRVPGRLVAWAGIPIGMHYLGGSLSGLHQVGGPNGLYYAFPWWDNVVHFLGAAAFAVIMAHLLAPRIQGRAIVVLAAVGLTVLGGTFVELYEFANFAWLGTVDQGYYTNTMLDLYYNALGATVAALGYTRFG